MTKWNETWLPTHCFLALLLLAGNSACGQLLHNDSVVDSADWNGFDNTPSWGTTGCGGGACGGTGCQMGFAARTAADALSAVAPAYSEG